MIPALKELLNLAECQNEEIISDQEYANILFKLKIKQACVNSPSLLCLIFVGGNQSPFKIF